MAKLKEMKHYPMRALALTSTIIFFAVTAAAQAPIARSTTMPLRDFLVQIAEKYDCYFTLETGVEPQSHSRFFNANIRPGDLKHHNLGEALRRLAKTVPYFSYTFSTKKPNLVHIADARLERETAYPLTRIVNSIRFEGTVSDLVRELSRRGIAVTSRTVVDSYEVLGLDLATKVRLRERKKSVRQILSDSIELEGRGRILWIAETKLGRDQDTSIRYMR